MGLRLNQGKLIRTQEQVATGRRILRPSDDPIGSARSLSLTRRIANIERQADAVISGRGTVESASSILTEGSSLLSDARELMLQGMNGTLSQGDREAIATELEVIRAELVDIANHKVGDRYLFGGTLTDTPPWVEGLVGGQNRVGYAGNDEEQAIRVSENVDLAINLPGSEIFGKIEHGGTVFDGLTGIAGGTTADEGEGWESLTLRHDSTDPGTLASTGIALVNGGAGDSLLGANALVIDTTAGTIQLGNGQAVPIPNLTDPSVADFVVANENGGELHLDLSGFNGADFTGTITGNGSISIDGSNFTPLTFSETDLELVHDATGSILHVDTTGVRRAGVETATFSGAVNLFDVLEGVVEDLRNPDGLSPTEINDRLAVRLTELDRHQGNVLVGVGILGSRGARLDGAEQRLQGVDLQLQGLLSDTRDVDLAEAVVDLVRAEQTLQLAQATGSRLIQNNLLNFLR